MRILFLSFFLLSACSLFQSQPSSPTHPEQMPAAQVEAVDLKEEPQPKHRLMVLPFLNDNTAHPSNIRTGSRQKFIKEMNKNFGVIVMGSQDLSADTNLLVKNGQYDLNEVSKLANALGVGAVMEGKILDIRIRRKADQVGVFRQVQTHIEVIVRVRIVSTRSTKELVNSMKTVSVDDSKYRIREGSSESEIMSKYPDLMEELVADAFYEFAPAIQENLNQLSWEGRIAAIRAERIYLNVGRITGLKIGDILKVSDEGEDIFDPQTGHFIGKVPGRLKGTLEVVSFFGKDGAIAVIHSGGAFRENDRVELY